MASWCLIKQEADKFLSALKDGSIDPYKMFDMSSGERHDYLTKVLADDSATQVNALFESKLGKKARTEVIQKWIDKSTKDNSPIHKDLIAQVEKMKGDVFKSVEIGGKDIFLEDLAKTKLGVGVSEEEAKSIFDLSEKAQKADDIWQKKLKDNPNIKWQSDMDRIQSGMAKVNIANYINELKNKSQGNILLNTIKDPLHTVPDLSKSVVASMDDSAIFHQGWKTLITNPLIWRRNTFQSFSDLVRTVGGKAVMDEVHADIISRPTYKMMQKAKLAVSNIEDEYPTSLPEKVPVLGKIYKASENAYTGFVYRQRADIFDKYIDIAKKSGVDLQDKELQSIGQMVNSLTGRGEFPGAKELNSVFFSARNIKSNVDTLLHPLTGAGGSNFVRKQSAVNLVKIVTATAAIMTIANAIKPGSAETDSRSADLGKIKVGDTRFDITGGMGSIAVLAARLITNSSKSSTTGKINPLNSGTFGSQKGMDVVNNFLENKLSPAGQIIMDMINRHDNQGNPITPGGEMAKLFTPLSVSTYEDLNKDKNSANTLLSLIADGLGINTNTYSQPPKNWTNNPTTAQSAFKSKVGDTTFQQANQEYNQQYDNWLHAAVNNPKYQALSDSSKQSVLNTKQSALQAEVFKKHGFVYKAPKATVQSKQERQQVKDLAK